MTTRKYVIKRDGASPPPVRYRVDYQGQLNQAQYGAVVAGEGPTLVIAGPGSGKTRTVTYRVARLLESGQNPASILLLTFTNRAAREMLRRVDLLLPGATRGVMGGTFHSVGHRILRQHPQALGYAEGFGILDREDAHDVMGQALADLALDPRKQRLPQPRAIGAMLSLAINTRASLEQVVLDRYSRFEPQIDTLIAICQRYLARKVEMNVMDFDDLLLNWLRLLEEHEAVRQHYAERFRWILVDEYQDTNRLQSAVVEKLASHHRNLTVVGDDGQSIYAFRGAEVRNLVDFAARWPETALHKLEDNYRSTPEILALANRVLAHNPRQIPKTLRAACASGPLPALVQLTDEPMQAAFVAERVLELRDEGTALAEMAVLYRAHAHSMALQLELNRRGIPFRVRSGLRFFEQAHIKDVLSYLRAVVNPRDEVALGRVLRLYPGIGRATAGRLIRAMPHGVGLARALADPAVARHLTARSRQGFGQALRLFEQLDRNELRQQPGEMISAVLDGGYRDWLERESTNPEPRKQDIEHFADHAARFETVDQLLVELALETSYTVDEVRPDDDDDEQPLILSTIHQAKGLEWTSVFVLWLAEGRFPAGRSLSDPDEEDEERRLFYVAVTRAKRDLHLCVPQRHLQRNGRVEYCRPSRFVREVDDRYLPPEGEPLLLERWQVTDE